MILTQPAQALAQPVPLREPRRRPIGAKIPAKTALAPPQPAPRVARVIPRKGNTSSLKGVGEGVQECRIDVGPGYRVYLGRDGATLVILQTGGTKKRQQRDIEAAKAMWADYRRRKPKGK